MIAQNAHRFAERHFAELHQLHRRRWHQHLGRRDRAYRARGWLGFRERFGGNSVRRDLIARH
ncbi:MAG: hypothetical protein C0483_19265 [Pirellula sp.]|nr:hypothetical protein [Pirellula sp.]